jgi:hypothetical protein
MIRGSAFAIRTEQESPHFPSQRLLVKLIIAASLLAVFFELGAGLQKRGLLPFGFRYQVSAPGLRTKGSLNKIDKTGLEKILKGLPAPRHILFFSEIYAAKSERIFFHVLRPECITLVVNGETIPIGTRKYYIPLALKKGFNPITIQYVPAASNPADLHIAFSENATLLPFPFFRLVQPGKPFSLPKIVFYLIRAIDGGRTLIFSLVLLIIFFRLPNFFLAQHDHEAGRSISLFQLVLQLLVDTFSAYNISVFCFYMLKIRIPLFVFLWASLSLGLFLLFLTCKKRTVRVALNWKKAGICIGIALIVFLYVFASCGSFLPLEPIGYGDFNAHLRMIKSIQLQGHFLSEENRGIYPQSVHAAIVSGAQILGLQPEEWITPFLMLMLAGLMFSIYLLGNELFPGIPIYFWVVSLGISNVLFIFRSMFQQYSFPAIIAVSLFAFSLFFHLRKSTAAASLSLAASLVIYPYFAPAFLTGIVIFFLWIESPFRLRKWLQLAVSLLPSLLAMGIYITIYVTQGFPQAKEGFVTAYLLNPFLSLRFWNTSLIFIAIAFCFLLKNAKPALGVFSAIVCGFFLNYIPYAVFHATSTYYVMKNMLLLIAIGWIYVAAALFFMVRKFWNKKWLLPIILFLSLPLAIESYLQTASQAPLRVARGTTAANRWLVMHTSSTDTILLDVGNGELLQFFLQTLGVQRKLIPATSDSSVVPSEVSWLVTCLPTAAETAKSKNMQKVAAFSDFSIFRLHKINPQPHG